MSRLPADPALVRRALGGHAAIGLLASALLYVIALSGTLAVVHDQWARWEQPAAPEMERLSPDAAQAAVVRAAGGARTTTLSLALPTPDFPRAVVTTDRGSRYADAAGRLAGIRTEGWDAFVVVLHETLCLPATWGMILVGAVGVALVALTVTGVLAHPRILRDAFRLRARHGAPIARVDWHNRLGVWTLPFALAVALTGAFLGLSGVGTALMARLDAGGDAQRVYAPVFGGIPAASDTRAAPLADVAAALRTLAKRVPHAAPTLAVIRAPGTRGQDIQIYATHPRRLIFGESYAFDAQGRWKGSAGLADGAIGQQFAASTYDLHFGNFGGPVVEIAYVLLGLCLCAIIATGTSIWLHKRRSRGLGSDRLAACWTFVIWGTPLVLVACAGMQMAALPELGLGLVFWTLCALGIAIALTKPGWFEGPRLRNLTAAAIATTGAIHLLLAGPMPTGPVLIDGALIGFGWIAIVLRSKPPAGAGPVQPSVTVSRLSNRPCE